MQCYCDIESFKWANPTTQITTYCDKYEMAKYAHFNIVFRPFNLRKKKKKTFFIFIECIWYTYVIQCDFRAACCRLQHELANVVRLNFISHSAMLCVCALTTCLTSFSNRTSLASFKILVRTILSRLRKKHTRLCKHFILPQKVCNVLCNRGKRLFWNRLFRKRYTIDEEFNSNTFRNIRQIVFQVSPNVLNFLRICQSILPWHAYIKLY